MRTDPRPTLRLSLLIVALLSGTAAQADWKREYDRGLKAVDDGNWSEAEARFAQAISEDGTPLARKRFEGVRYNHYVPHYFAGLAAFRQGNCAKAVEYWSHAATNTELAKLAALQSEQQRGLGTCRTQLAQQAAPPAQPPAVASTTTTPPATPPVSPPATPAAAPSGSTSTQRPATSSSAPATAATAPVERPPASTAPTTPAASGPAPTVLRTTLDAYLAGRYADVQRVDAATASDARTRAQLHLLRAAAAYTLAQVNGDGEAALEAARREVRAARAAQSSLAPDGVLFSPRFRNFWQQTR